MTPRPTGTVTFLFTDIEGSTRHWEEHRAWMQHAFARQEQIIREAAVAHDGYVYKMVGDAFQIAFPTAQKAIAAAVEAQRALQLETWGDGGPLRVRMALQTGVTEERGDDYLGPALNRLARMLVAGWGGQVLISEATRCLAEDDLPADIYLRDLGEHRLPGLGRPEHIYQLTTPGLTPDFPKLRTSAAFAHNLPFQVTSFIGREKEITELKELVQSTPLVTLEGAGGSGKTRLALQTALSVLEDFPDGTWWVELGPLSDPALVPASVATILGLREQPGIGVLQLLADYLRPKRLLLVLDNAEHLIDACGQLVDALMRNALHVHLLVTSREALRVAGEQTYSVPPLQLPDVQSPPEIEAIAHVESVRLFVERAKAIHRRFAVTRGNASSIVQICRRLDGIPLAIELAAARVQALSPEQIAQRLDDRFQLLTGGGRTALPRQQTLRALIDWSYNLLPPQERLLFHRLSVFAGGWTLEMAEEICADETIHPAHVLDLLSRLVAKSLVVVDESGEDTRYRMLETIRQYAYARLLESGEGERVWTRHLEFFVRFAEEAEIQFCGPGQKAWLNRVQLEHENLRAVLEYAEKEDLSEKGLGIAGTLWQFWFRRGHWSEGFERTMGLLTHTGETGDKAVRSKGLLAAGLLAWCRDGQSTSDPWLEEGIAVARGLGENGKSLLALALALYGYIKIYQDSNAARALSEEGLGLAREMRIPWVTGLALCNLGQVAESEGDLAVARALFEEDLTALSSIGDNSLLGAVLCNLGGVLYDQGDHERGKADMQAGLTIYRQLGDKGRLAIMLNSLGRILSRGGDFEAARFYLQESWQIAQALGATELASSASAALSAVAAGERILPNETIA